MADAVDADQAFSSTCGSSWSVKSATLPRHPRRGRRRMVQHGEEPLTATLAPAHSTRAAIGHLPGLRVMGEAELVPVDQAVGRLCAGTESPGPVDPEQTSFRVVARSR